MIQDSRVQAIADEIISFFKAPTAVDILSGDISKGKMPDLSLEYLVQTEHFAGQVREQIAALMKERLGHYDQMALEIMDFMARGNFETGYMPLKSDYYYLDFAMTPYSCVLSYLPDLGSLPIPNQTVLEQYVRTISDYPRLVRQICDKTMEQARRGIYLPVEETTLVLNMLRVNAHTAETSPLRLEAARIAHIPGDHSEEINQVRTAIDAGYQIMQELIAFLQSDDYRARQMYAVGLHQYPAGMAYYRYLVKYHLTYDIEPETVNRLGYEEIEKIEKRMEEIRKALGYSCTRAEFQEITKKMPELYEDSPEKIGDRMNRYLNRIKPVMKDYFGTPCKADCEVARLPIEKEGTMTFGYYSMPSASQPKGQYLYNGSNHREKNQIGCGALTYHELLPGHHHQICVTNENERIHPFFRTLMITAYAEGWAEYAAALAGEMGMFETLLDEYGSLTMDLFLTTRLVVDTGMNLGIMTREEAAKLLKANSEWNDTMIFTETNRYSNDIPGQALGYKFGKLMMFKIREKAKQALGPLFDIREYHDRVLEMGTVPMQVLEKHIDWYVAQKKENGRM